MNDQTVSGNGYVQLSNSRISKVGKTLELNTDINLNDTLFIDSGKVELNKTLQLEQLGHIYGETEYNNIYGEGKISCTKEILPGNYQNLNGLGLNLVTFSSMGNTLIEREFIAFNLNGQNGINRVYNITPENNSGLNVNLSFNYWNSELNDNLGEELKIYKSIDSGLNWTQQSSTLNTTTNTLSLSGITSFSKWSAGSEPPITLAVELISFKGERTDDNIELEWEVLSEVNSKSYQLNYSYDGFTFDSLTTISANNSRIYSYLWQNGPKETVYFELIEIENNGGKNHLDTIVVFGNESDLPEAWVHEDKIHTKNFPRGAIKVYDNRGRLIMTDDYNTNSLAPGLYHIELYNELGHFSFKFWKK